MISMEGWFCLFQPAKPLCSRLHTFPSTCYWLEAAVESLYVEILTEAASRMGTRRGLGKCPKHLQREISCDSLNIPSWRPWSPCVIVISAALAALAVSRRQVYSGQRQLPYRQKWSESETMQRRRGGGHWYVRNVAKANTKAPPPKKNTHTPEFNEINAADFSCTKATSDRDAGTAERSRPWRWLLQEHQLGWTWAEPGSAGLRTSVRQLSGQLCVNRKRRGWTRAQPAENHRRLI